MYTAYVGSIGLLLSSYGVSQMLNGVYVRGNAFATLTRGFVDLKLYHVTLYACLNFQCVYYFGL